MQEKNYISESALGDLFNGQSGGRQYVGIMPEEPAKMNGAAFLGEEEFAYYVAKDTVEEEGRAENLKLIQRADARHMVIAACVNQGHLVLQG